MPDVFSPTWVKALANVLPSGASRLIAKVTGDDAYYNLGAPRDIDIQFQDIGKPDTLLRQQSWGDKIVIKIPSLQAGLVEIQNLQELVSPLNQPILWAITELDGKFIKDDGTKTSWLWVLNAGGKFDDYRSIEYMIAGNIATTEQDAFFSASGPTIGTPNAGTDKQKALTQAIISANQKPNGIVKVEFKASADAAYADFGDFNDNKVSFSCLFEPGGGGRQLPRVHGIQIDFMVMGLQTSLTEKQLRDSIIANSIDLKLTFQDGVVFTLPNTNFGAHSIYKNIGNADKVRTVDFIGGGAVCNWDGTAFKTVGGTAWTAMWA